MWACLVNLQPDSQAVMIARGHMLSEEGRERDQPGPSENQASKP